MKNATPMREKREECGLSQEELEKRSGVEQTVISRMERVGPARGVRNAIAIARALGVTVEQLFGESSPARAANESSRA